LLKWALAQKNLSTKKKMAGYNDQRQLQGKMDYLHEFHSFTNYMKVATQTIHGNPLKYT
jgi:hypothetical protein